MIGTTISHYKILEKLGEGGMGVVYKAHDTKLKRDVAIKFLPSQSTQAGVERERLLQEAQAAAAINHPNICVIHEIHDEAEQPFIVMEYVDGETIRRKLESGPMTVDDGLRYGIQIGEALHEAHTKGIVHRDIKADNIIINSKGLAKVMDFGLAKLKGSHRLTRISSTVGTLGYMAPEQISGGEVDARSDIFAFGVLFFEMITGRLPFRGEHEAAMVYSIVNEDPEPITKYIPDISGEIVHTVAKALEKDPDDRYQQIQEMVVDLRRSKRDSTKIRRISSVERKASDVPVVAQESEVRFSRKKLWIGISAIAVLVVAIVSSYFLFASRPGSTLPPMRTMVFTSYPGIESSPAVSPEGNSIAFVWNGDQEDNYDIYVKLIDAGSPLRLTTDPGGEQSPAWSPDGRYVAYSRGRDGVTSYYIVPSLGGSERKIADTKYAGSGIDWSPDGRTLAISATDDPGTHTGITLVAVETGQKRQITKPEVNYTGDENPKYSPDGTLIAYTRSFSYGVSELYTLPANGGKENQLTFDNLEVGSVAWTEDGKEIVFSSNRGGSAALWRIPSDGGSPVPVAGSGDDIADVAIGKKGNILAYSRQTLQVDICQFDLRSRGSGVQTPRELVSASHKQYEPQFSPDGTHIAFTSNRSGSIEIWVCDSDGTHPVQLTFFRGPAVGTPRWSPDSHSLTFDCREKGNGNIYTIRASGGAPRQLTSGNFDNNIPSWSRDGRWIYFSSNRTGMFQIWKIPADGGEEIQVTKNGGFSAVESTDGKELYFAQKNYDTQLWRKAVAGGEEQPIDKRLSGLQWGLWEVTDGGIYFAKPDSSGKGHIALYDLHSQAIRPVMVTPKALWSFSGAMSVSPDGGKIVFTQVDRLESDIVVLQNFQ